MKPAPGYEEAAKKFDPDHSHCRECVCAGCLYFYHNRRGDCLEGCYVCDQESHTGGCGMFEPLGGGGMEQLTFGLDSTEERELVLPPTKAQRLLAVLNAAIVRSGLDIRVTHINVKHSTMDDIGFRGFYEGLCQYFTYTKGETPRTPPTWQGEGECMHLSWIYPYYARGNYGNMIYVEE